MNLDNIAPTPRHRKTKLQPGIYRSEQLEGRWLVVDGRHLAFLVPVPDPNASATDLAPWKLRVRWAEVPVDLDVVLLEQWEEVARSACGIPAEMFAKDAGLS